MANFEDLVNEFDDEDDDEGQDIDLEDLEQEIENRSKRRNKPDQSRKTSMGSTPKGNPGGGVGDPVSSGGAGSVGGASAGASGGAAATGGAAAGAGAGAAGGATGGAAAGGGFAALLANPIFWIVVVVLLVIILVVLAVVMAVSFFQDQKEVRENGMATGDGVKGYAFYGCRVIYKNDELARQQMIEDYINIVSGSLQGVADFTVNLTLPQEDYNYENFNNLDASSDYFHLYTIVNNMADIMYKHDNDAEPTDIEFVEVLDGIKYFGIESDIATLTNQIATSISGYVLDNNLYTLSPGGTLPTVEELSIHVENYIKINQPTVRVEKLIVKDYILADNEQMPNTFAEQYVGMLFMPKKQIIFDFLSFKTMDTDENFEMWIQNGETRFSLSEIKNKELGTDLYESFGHLNQIVYEYEYGQAMETPAGINQLFDLDNNEYYFKLLTDENGNEYYTFNFNGMSVQFNANQPFFFAESITNYH
ncbi:MAG: hypothetical protein IKM43_01115 [Clostridia bacterium]|nr:hypothetical protein [Clostridia bacterium]